MTDAILALNAGSSSIKFGLFETAPGRDPVLVSKGLLEDAGPKPSFTAKGPDGKDLTVKTWPEGSSHEEMLSGVLDWITAHLGADTLIAVGHRVVHGGRDFDGPVQLSETVMTAIAALTPLAPLHQPRSLEPIRAIAKLRPDLPQTASFDTAFHHGLAPPVSRYAIPREYEADGVRKYGFHGLSYEAIAGKLRAISPELAARRTVVAHLGSGASLCAMREGQSIDTTMGFTALDGLVMGTRCGAIDPGVLIYLQQARGLSAKQVEDLLYHKSGLLGVSGLSADMRTLLASQDPRAREAVDQFAFSIARETAAMANSLGGLDSFVFTGGIGEHTPEVRAMVCAQLAWLGLDLDPAQNQHPDGLISRSGSRVEIRMIPTDEEGVIARQALGVISR